MKTPIPQLFILLLTVWFASLQNAHAVSPAPDGGYPGGNTAEGQNALFSLSTGGYNTAAGFFSLRSDAAGSFNTGVGAGTLLANTITLESWAGFHHRSASSTTSSRWPWRARPFWLSSR
jgi:hypothetical protein